MKTKALSENKMALFNILSTIIIAGINFFTIPIFTRMLDTSGYGIVNVYSAWVSIFVIFIGLKADGTIGSAKANLPEEEQDSYQFSILVLSFLAFIALFIVTIIFLQPISSLLNMDPTITVCMVIQSFGSCVISLFSMRYIFNKNAQFNFLLSVGICIATTLTSVLLIFFVFTGTNAYFGRILGLCLPSAILGAILAISLAVKQHGVVKSKYWHFCLSLSLPLIFHGLSQLVLGQTGKIVVQQTYGDSAAGIYSIAVTIVTLLNVVYGALNNAFVPFMYDDLAGKTPESVKQSHFKNYFTSFTLGTIAFVFLSPEILKLMSTRAYWDAIQLLPLLTVGQYCIFLYSFPVNYEFYKMQTKSIATGTILAAILNIVLTLVLTPIYGLPGAAFATMIAYIALFIFHFCIARFALGDNNYPGHYYVIGIISVILISALCYPLANFYIIRWVIAFIALICVGVRVVKTRSIF